MRILMIEDDKELCKAVKLQLDASGYETDLCHDGNDALYYGLQPVYDLIILDRMLPGIDGLSVLKLLRENQIHTPVIMATAMDTVSQRIAGLDCGADDYIVKPFDVGELLARIRALTRRPVLIEKNENLTFGDLTFDSQSHELTVGDKQFRLSGREALLAEYFLQNPGQTLSRSLIYSRIWGPDGEVEDGNLDTYIYYLRKHLKALKSCTQITTVHGVGYRLEKKTC